jgi:hypothetical protein
MDGKEKEARFDQWWNEKGFDVEDDVTDVIHDCCMKLFDAIRDVMKLNEEDADYVPPPLELLPETLRWVFGADCDILETMEKPESRRRLIDLVKHYPKRRLKTGRRPGSL